MRSTSGYHLAVEGPWTSLPQTGASARQTALSNSTPEAEFAACHLAHKKAYLPSLDLYDKLLPEGYHKVVREDNQAVLKLCRKARSVQMRHVGGTHSVSLEWVYEGLTVDPCIKMRYTKTKDQLADVFTKGRFTCVQWRALCAHSGIVPAIKVSTSLKTTKHAQN